MTKRSVLQEHAKRRAEEREKESDDYLAPEEYSKGVSPKALQASEQRRAKLPPKEDTGVAARSKALIKAQRAKENLELDELSKKGEKGRKAAEQLRQRREKLKDKEDKQLQKEIKAQSHHLIHIPLITADEGKKTRKLAEKHHKEHIKELKEARKHAEKKGFWERGVFGKIAWILGTLWHAYMLYNKVKLAMWIGRKLTPAFRGVGRGIKSATKGIGEGIARRFPKVGRAAEGAAEHAKRVADKLAEKAKKKAEEKLSQAQRDKLKEVGNKAKSFGRKVKGGILGGLQAPAVPATAKEGMLDVGLNLLKGGGLGTLARMAVPLAAGGYAAYQGVKHAGTVLDGSQTTGDRLQAGAHLAASGAGAVLGGPVGAAVGNLAADGAEWVGKKLANTGFGEMLGSGIAHVLSPFSEEASDAVKATAKASSSAADQVKAGQDAAKTNLAERSALDDKFFTQKKAADVAAAKDLSTAVAPVTESTKTFAESIKTYTDAASRAAGTLWGGIKSGARSVMNGVGEGADKVVEGYKKGGFKGAVDAGGSALKSVGKGVLKGGGELISSAGEAATGLQYDLSKGSKDQLKLAMGFSGKNTVKGLTDSHTKALAGNTMSTESAGKLNSVNSFGYSGQYQMGADALADNGVINPERLKAAKAASKASGKDWYKDGDHKAFMSDNTNWQNKGGRDAFLKDKQMQDDLFVKYTNKNVDAGLKSGALSAKSTPEEIAAYAKAAHLKGAGGADALMLKGKDGVDANGTSAAKYAKDARVAVKDLAAKVDVEKSKAVSTDTASAKPGVAKPTEVAYVEPSLSKTAKPVVGSTLPVDTSTAPAPLAVQRAEMTSAPESARATASAVTPAPAPVERVAQGASQPLPLIAKNVPTESHSQAMQVAKATAASAQPERESRSPPQARGGNQSSMPTLDEMPIMISDLGLVLLNIGHV